MKKDLIIGVLVTMLVQLCAFAQTDSKVLLRITGLGIMSYDQNGSFRGNDNITRAEACTVIARLIQVDENKISRRDTVFTDVPKEYWASGYIATINDRGIVNGMGDGIFKPGENVCYEQMVKMLVATLDGNDKAVVLGGYPSGYIEQAKKEGLLNDISIEYGKILTRLDVATMIYNALEKLELASAPKSAEMLGINEISEFINSEIDKNNLSGVSVQIVKNGVEALNENYGYSNTEKKIPMKSDTIMRMMSMTKPVVSVAIILLCDRGIINLDDPISKYIESYKNQKNIEKDGKEIPLKSEATIKDLLNNKAGVGFAYGDEWNNSIALAKSGKGLSTIEVANIIGRVPLNSQPGEKWQYSHSADVLGAVIEVATDKKLGTFLNEEFFVPLGMNDTAFYVPENKYYRLALMYEHKADGTLIPTIAYHPFDPTAKTQPNFESGAAGLYSTTNDYAKFAQMLLNDGTYGGKRYLKKETVDNIHTNQLTDKQLNEDFTWNNQSTKGYTYGNFFRILNNVELNGCNGNLGEYGWYGYIGTYFAVDPMEDLTFQINFQLTGLNYDYIINKIRTIIYKNLKK